MSNNLPNDYEIVVAHYNEDLEWLKSYADHAIIYHKWNEDKPRFPVKKRIKLPNIWRESHTYLYHIIHNYHNLADYTLFFQWWIEDHKKDWWVYDDFNKYLKEANKYWFSCSQLFFFKKKEPQIVFNGKFLEMIKSWSLKKSKYSFSEFYEKLMWKHQKYITPFFYAANFWVSKHLIKSKPLSFWKNVISLLPENSNPEEWHFFERLWYTIFYNKMNIHFLLKIMKTIIETFRLYTWNKK